MKTIHINDDFPISPKQYAEMFFDRQYTAGMAEVAKVDKRTETEYTITCAGHPEASPIDPGQNSGAAQRPETRHAMHDGDRFVRSARYDVHSKVPSMLPNWAKGLYYDETFDYVVGSNLANWLVKPESNGGLGKYVTAHGEMHFENSPAIVGGTRRHLVATVELSRLPFPVSLFESTIESIATNEMKKAYKKGTVFTNQWIKDHPPAPELPAALAGGSAWPQQAQQDPSVMAHSSTQA